MGVLTYPDEQNIKKHLPNITCYEDMMSRDDVFRSHFPKANACLVTPVLERIAYDDFL